MTVNPIIINALSEIGMPVSANVYTGDADEYITFNYADERPLVYGDNTDLYDETTVHVHYFTRGNPQANKKRIRRLLRAAGFTVLSTSEFYESDTKYTHVVVEVWIESAIND